MVLWWVWWKGSHNNHWCYVMCTWNQFPMWSESHLLAKTPYTFNPTSISKRKSLPKFELNIPVAAQIQQVKDTKTHLKCNPWIGLKAECQNLENHHITHRRHFPFENYAMQMFVELPMNPKVRTIYKPHFPPSSTPHSEVDAYMGPHLSSCHFPPMPPHQEDPIK